MGCLCTSACAQAGPRAVSGRPWHCPREGPILFKSRTCQETSVAPSARGTAFILIHGRCKHYKYTILPAALPTTAFDGD